MPHSHPDSQEMITNLVTKHAKYADTIVDVGPGVGTYGDKLRPIGDARMVAVEKWAPYVANFNLGFIYDQVIIADAAWLDWNRLIVSENTLVVFGDVLEHMTFPDALAAWNGARRHARWAALALPIVEYPQEEQFGNPYEKHLTQWDHNKVLESFPGIIDYELGPVVGAYMAGNE